MEDAKPIVKVAKMDFYATAAVFEGVATPDEIADAGTGITATVLGAVGTGIGLALTTRGNPEAGLPIAGLAAAEAALCGNIVMRSMRKIIRERTGANWS